MDAEFYTEDFFKKNMGLKINRKKIAINQIDLYFSWISKEHYSNSKFCTK